MPSTASVGSAPLASKPLSITEAQRHLIAAIDLSLHATTIAEKERAVLAVRMWRRIITRKLEHAKFADRHRHADRN